jgi:hypothetical protein
LDLQINSQIFFSSFRYGTSRENPFGQTVGPQRKHKSYYLKNF